MRKADNRRRLSAAGHTHRDHVSTPSPLFEAYAATDRRARTHLFAGEQQLRMVSRLQEWQDALEATR